MQWMADQTDRTLCAASCRVNRRPGQQLQSQSGIRAESESGIRAGWGTCERPWKWNLWQKVRIRPEDGGVQINSEAGVAKLWVFYQSSSLNLRHSQIIAPACPFFSVEITIHSLVALRPDEHSDIDIEQAPSSISSFMCRYSARSALRVVISWLPELYFSVSLMALRSNWINDGNSFQRRKGCIFQSDIEIGLEYINRWKARHDGDTMK